MPYAASTRVLRRCFALANGLWRRSFERCPFGHCLHGTGDVLLARRSPYRRCFRTRGTWKRTGERHVESTSATRVFSFQRREPTSCVATDDAQYSRTARFDESSVLRRTTHFRGHAFVWFGFAVSLFGSRATMHTDRLTIRHQPNLEEVFEHGLQGASRMGLA